MKRTTSPRGTRLLYVATITVAILLLCAGVMVLAQQGKSFTKTQPDDLFGKGGTSSITETKDDNGEVTIEGKFYDPQKKLRVHSTTTKRPDGTSTSVRESYDCDGKLQTRGREETDAQGKTTTKQGETYQDGVLKDGVWITEP